MNKPPLKFGSMYVFDDKMSNIMFEQCVWQLISIRKGIKAECK